MVAIILIVIGLLIVSVDIYAPGIMYPAYEYTNNIGTNIQQYVTQNITSDHLKIDVLPDVVGCIFLFIGASMLLKYSRKYMQALFFTVVMAVVSVAIPVLPFFIGGQVMVVTELILFFALTVFEVYMEYLVIYTTVDISDDTPNQSTNKRLQFGWWITVFCRVFITFLTFVGHIGIANAYKIVLAAAALFYLYQMLGICKYIGTRRSKKWTEKVLEKEEEKQHLGRLR